MRACKQRGLRGALQARGALITRHVTMGAYSTVLLKIIISNYELFLQKRIIIIIITTVFYYG